MHPVFKYPISDRTSSPKPILDKTVQADGLDRQTPGKKWQPHAAPGQGPRPPPARMQSLGVVHFRFDAHLKVKGQLQARKSQAGLTHVHTFYTENHKMALHLITCKVGETYCLLFILIINHYPRHIFILQI